MTRPTTFLSRLKAEMAPWAIDRQPRWQGANEDGKSYSVAMSDGDTRWFYDWQDASGFIADHPAPALKAAFRRSVAS